MTLNITNTQTPLDQVNTALEQVQSAEPVVRVASANPPVKTGKFATIDIGISVSQLLREGVAGTIGLLMQRFNLPTSRAGQLAQRLVDLARGTGVFVSKNNAIDIDQAFKFEVDLPIQPTDEDWAKNVTVIFKIGVNFYRGLNQTQKDDFARYALNMTPAMARLMIGSIEPRAANVVSDIRLVADPFTPDWSWRAGAMFILPTTLFTRDRDGNPRADLTDKALVAFMSPRVWPDGSLQLLFGVEISAGLSRTGLRSGLPGDPWAGIAGGFSIKINQGTKLVRVDDGWGVPWVANGEAGVLKLPDGLVAMLPMGFEDITENAQSYDAGKDGVLFAFADVASDVVRVQLPADRVNSTIAEIRRHEALIRTVNDFVSSPLTRDAATLLSGLLGFKGGPITGVISTALALGQISENQYRDFYLKFLTVKSKDAQSAVQLLNSSIDLIIEERARRLQFDAEQVRLGLRNSTETSINAEARGAINKLVELYDRAIGESITSGWAKYSAVDYYKELTRLSTGSDPFQGEIAKNILGIRGNGPSFLYFSNEQGGGRVRLNDDYRSPASKTFSILSKIDRAVASGGQNKINLSDFNALQNDNLKRQVAGYFLDSGGDPVNLLFTIYKEYYAAGGAENKNNVWSSIRYSGASSVIDLIYKNMFTRPKTLDSYGFTDTWYDGYQVVENGQVVWKGVGSIGSDLGLDGVANINAALNRLKERSPTDPASGGKKQYYTALGNLALELVSSGYDFNFGNADLAARIAEAKLILTGQRASKDSSPNFGWLSEERFNKLKGWFKNGWISAGDYSQVKQQLQGNANGLLIVYNETLVAGVGNNPIIADTLGQPGGAPIARTLTETKIAKEIEDIYSRSDLTLEQKNKAIRQLLSESGLNQRFINEKLQELETRIGVRLIEQGNLTNLKTQTTEALRIARESGNQLGVVLATLVNGVIDTLLAKVDDSTANLQFSGSVNAIAAAAQAAGLTFSEFVQLIGRGDLAAFGAVIGDIGEVYKQANLGNTASTIGAGFELVGNALNAVGRQKGDKGLIIAGTAINGVGSVLKASQGPVGAATTAGFKMAGNLASVLGQLGNSNELQALGLTLNAVVDIPRLFTNYNPETGAGRTDGSAALATAASQIAGLLLGGEAGRIVSGIGSLVSTGFQIAGNTVPGGEGALYVTAARQLLSLLGVKLDPAVNFALGTLSTALAGGPVGWAVWAVGLLFNFAQMGSFSKTSLLAENIDADGDGFADDNASLRQDFRRGFFGNVRQTGHQILYDVNGVDVRLLQNSAINISPETRNTPVTILSNRGISYSAVINGQSVLLQLVDGNGTLLNNQGKIPGMRGFSEPVGGVFFQVPAALVASGSPIARLLGGFVPTSAGLGAQRFAAVAVGNPDRGGTWNIAQETGNFIVKIDATYEAINPSTTAINTSKSWVVSPADAAVWRNYIGGNSGTIGGNDPRAKSGGLLANALNDMTAQYRGQNNDPNLYMYMDMNGDKTPDLVRVGLQMDGLREKGDGKVEVWLLDANRKQTGMTYIANSFGEAEVIGLMGNQLMNWGAGKPENWPQGRDLGSFYIQARNSGALALMQEANQLTSTTISALLSGGGSNLEAAFARLDQINRALASPFNANQYMAANPDVATWAGGDPIRAAQHYIGWGNKEGRTVNAAGLVLAKPVSRNTLVNGTLLTNQTIVSDNGQYFAVFQTDGNLAVYRGSPSVYSQATWSSMTGWKAEGGSATMQADGNLVVRDAAGNAKWSSGTDGGAGVNRGFKLVMQDDGNLVIYDTQGGGALWSTNGRRIAKPVANLVSVAQPVAQPVIQQSPIAALLSRAQPAVVQAVAQSVVQPVVQPAAPLSPIARALQGQLAGYRNVGNTLAA